MRGLTLITPPAAEPVTLAEARAHLRIDGTGDDALIAALIAAAREAVESHTRRALMAQSWRLTLDRFPGAPLPWWDGVRQGADLPSSAGAIELPRPPLQSVASVTVFDDADAPAVVPAADYFVDTAREPGRIVLRSAKSWPVVRRAAAGVEIDFTAGYGAATDVPQAIRQGILLLAGYWFENREAVSPDGPAAEIPLGVAMLWRPWRVPGL